MRIVLSRSAFASPFSVPYGLRVHRYDRFSHVSTASLKNQINVKPLVGLHGGFHRLQWDPERNWEFRASITVMATVFYTLVTVTTTNRGLRN